MQPTDSSLFTPTEAAVLTRLPLKAAYVQSLLKA